MRCVVQKVSEASVTVNDEIIGSIGRGYMVLVGAEEGDTEADVNYCVEKLVGLRVLEDDNDKLNLSIAAVGGSMLLVYAAGGCAPRPPSQLHSRRAAGGCRAAV